jgi:hypothetical protein
MAVGGPGDAGLARERGGDFPVAGAAAPPRPRGRTLGILEKPGKALAGTLQRVRAGEAIRFVTRENQIWGMGEITVEPVGALEVTRRALERCDPSLPSASGSSFVEYAFAVPAGARPGASIRVRAAGLVRTRSNPNWAFQFTIEVED